MPIITVSGNLGTGARDLAQTLATRLDLDYVDHSLIVEAARKLGVPVERMESRDERTPTMGERLAGILRAFLERSASVGATDPMLGASGLEIMLARSYEDEEATAEPDVSDRRYVEVLKSVIEGLAARGHVVIVGRGSHAVLKEHPGALHVNVVAPRDMRIELLMHREGIDREEAAHRVERSEQGRTSYHRKLFHSHPDDPNQYHLTLNASRMSQEAMLKTVLAALDAGVATGAG